MVIDTRNVPCSNQGLRPCAAVRRRGGGRILYLLFQLIWLGVVVDPLPCEDGERHFGFAKQNAKQNVADIQC